MNGRSRLNRVLSQLPPFPRKVLTQVFHLNLGLYFQIHAPDSIWNENGGIFIFSKRTSNSKWVALFIGETDSFRDDLKHHPQWQQAVSLGATHIHTRAYESHQDRRIDLQTLIKAYRPALNRLLRDVSHC